MKNKELDQLIEQSFGYEPDFQLPDNFARQVTAELKRRSQWKNNLIEYLFLIGFSSFLLTIVAGTYYLVNKEILIQILNFASQNIPSVIFVLVLLNFILFADRVLLPILFNSQNFNN